MKSLSQRDICTTIKKSCQVQILKKCYGRRSWRGILGSEMEAELGYSYNLASIKLELTDSVTKTQFYLIQC